MSSDTTITIVRRLEWDMGHTVTGHEGKCRHLHGHRYSAELHCSAANLDAVGRVIDFGWVKREVGAWIDEHWDHKFMINGSDKRALGLLDLDDSSVVVVHFNPTAENIATHLLLTASDCLRSYHVTVDKVVLYETPNGRAEVSRNVSALSS